MSRGHFSAQDQEVSVLQHGRAQLHDFARAIPRSAGLDGFGPLFSRGHEESTHLLTADTAELDY